MKEALAYFKAERAESLLFVGAGLVSVGLALWFWISVRKPFYSGLGTSLALIAVIQLVVGASVYVRTPADIKKVDSYLTGDRARIKSEELPRMEKVMHNFVTYRYVEILLALLGLCLIVLNKEPLFWKGFGAGLFAQSVLMLVLDFLAESRGKVYIDFLRSFIV